MIEDWTPNADTPSTTTYLTRLADFQRHNATCAYTAAGGIERTSSTRKPVRSSLLLRFVRRVFDQLSFVPFLLLLSQTSHLSSSPRSRTPSSTRSTSSSTVSSISLSRSTNLFVRRLQGRSLFSLRESRHRQMLEISFVLPIPLLPLCSLFPLFLLPPSASRSTLANFGSHFSSTSPGYSNPPHNQQSRLPQEDSSPQDHQAARVLLRSRDGGRSAGELFPLSSFASLRRVVSLRTDPSPSFFSRR